MQYYRSNKTGKIMSEGSLKVLNDIFGNNTIVSMVEDGLLVSIDPPAVIDCIRSGNLGSAFTRYRELHNCSLEEAKKAVYSMCADISRTNSIGKRKQKKAAANAK
jgi:hypothetical protein